MRNAIRKDIFFFAIPAAVVYSVGMAVSGWDLVRQQKSLYILSVPRIVGLVLVVTGLTILFVAAGTLVQLDKKPTLDYNGSFVPNDSVTAAMKNEGEQTSCQNQEARSLKILN